MRKIRPLEFFLWTFRRNEKDVVKLYDSLSDLMRIATGGNMLNFGYWDDTTETPIDAQKNLCKIFGKKAQLESKQHIVDVGSGIGSPALQWYSEYHPIELTCVNINFKQLRDSINNITKILDINQKNQNGFQKNFNFLNSTATRLPIENDSADCVLALESAQHFKPLTDFFSESYRILKKDGLFALAIPVILEDVKKPMKLGLLSMTWLSEHYSIGFIKSLLKKEGFHIIDLEKIGSNVYEPLANYYTKNRDYLKARILNQYSSYVEKILFKSLTKMKKVSNKKIIDYIIVTCEK